MNCARTLLIVALLALCASTFLVPAQPAAAAWGNVQLRIVTQNTTAKFTYVSVQGMNQRRDNVTWQRSFSPATSTASTDGWWWNASRKTIIVHFDNGVRLSCGVFHNAYPSSNWETVRIGPDGSVSASGPSNSCARI